jgi:hypothetical protein
MRLARRLDGLPLALVTAGAYLSQSADSFNNFFVSARYVQPPEAKS